mmetsp:Transcript_27275/g.60237  ORF Transcript_27275/g.60237 Transcript_27275/m.60237 type:complete len:225 (+) Transcript_27275:633-1307(+)
MLGGSPFSLFARTTRTSSTSRAALRAARNAVVASTRSEVVARPLYPLLLELEHVLLALQGAQTGIRLLEKVSELGVFTVQCLLFLSKLSDLLVLVVLASTVGLAVGLAVASIVASTVVVVLGAVAGTVAGNVAVAIRNVAVWKLVGDHQRLVAPHQVLVDPDLVVEIDFETGVGAGQLRLGVLKSLGSFLVLVDPLPEDLVLFLECHQQQGVVLVVLLLLLLLL